MLNQTFQELKDIQNLSNKMLLLAESGDWDKIPDIEQQRDKLIRHFFETHDLIASDRNKVEQAIHTVLQINNKMTALAEQEKLRINEHLHDLKKRQNVNSAYLQNR